MEKTLKFSGFALFIVYFWFGMLKIAGVSPATDMVLELLQRTMPFMDPEMFMILFGAFEAIIGILFLLPYTQRMGLAFLALHMVMVWSPLVLLPSVTWQTFLIPTMEGQYIIKNVLILAAAYYIHKNSKPLSAPANAASY